MAQGKQQLKCERNPCIRCRDNCDTDGWTTDGRLTNFDFISSADIVKNIKNKRKTDTRDEVILTTI